MDLCKCISLLVVFWFDSIESGGHHEGKHDHLKLYVPEFVHHDHHTKYITIHHHHHKPEKHHHHHHIHIPKSHPTFNHHYGYHKHKKGTTTLTTTSVKGGIGHGHHGHGHHGHGHHKHVHVPKHHHAKHHGHHGHKHHHHEAHDPYPVYEDDYDTSSYVPSSPHVPHIPQIPQIPHVAGHVTPHVHGVTHTVKQVKVFDSLPGALPTAGKGYEVTENVDDEEDDDVFNAISDLPQTYPSTYGFVRSAAPAPSNDPFSTIATHNFQPTLQDSFSPIPNSGPTGGSDVFTSTLSDHPSQSLGATAADIPSTFDTLENHEGFDSTATSFAGTAPSAAGGFLAAPEGGLHDDTPVTFSREAGIQQKVTTGGHETITY